MVCRGFAGPVGSSRGLRGRNVTVGARQVDEHWSAYTSLVATHQFLPHSRPSFAVILHPPIALHVDKHLRPATPSMTLASFYVLYGRYFYSRRL